MYSIVKAVIARRYKALFANLPLPPASPPDSGGGLRGWYNSRLASVAMAFFKAQTVIGNVNT
jgi:hypothetical protein